MSDFPLVIVLPSEDVPTIRAHVVGRDVGSRITKLSARRVATITEPGLYGDGHGLWLQVGPTGGRSWSFRSQLNRRARQIGLKPVDLVSLSEARDLARDARRPSGSAPGTGSR